MGKKIIQFMKIAHFFISFPNSYQKYNLRLVERLQKYQIENLIFTFKKNESDIKKLNIIELNQSKIKRLFQVLLNLKLFISFKNKFQYNYLFAYKIFTKFSMLLYKHYDVLHIHHTQTLSHDFLNFINFFKIKTVVTFRGSDLLIRPYRSDADFNFINNIFKSVSFAHTVSDNLKDELKKFNVLQENVFSIKRTPETLVKISRKKTEIFNITSIGRIHWTKGYIPTLIAISEVLKDIDKPIKFHICGSGEFEQLDEIRCWIRKLKLDDIVILHGYLNNDQIDDLLAITDLYIQPSVSEGIPNSLLRALNAKVIIIASRVGGIPEVINDKNGFLFDLDDFHTFKTLLKDVIDGKLRNEDFEFDYQEVSESIEIDSYKKMYSKIINHNRDE